MRLLYKKVIPQFKVFIASASVGLIALFIMPGYPGAYRLSKWGCSGFALLFLSGAFLFSIRKSAVFFVPTRRLLLLIATAFVTAAIILPIGVTPYTYAHIAGALRLLTGFFFAYLTALAFDRKTGFKRQSLAVILTVGAVCAIIVILQAIGINFLTHKYFTSAEFRSPGTFGNPNWAAAFLLTLVPVSLGLRSKCTDSRERLALQSLTALLIIGTMVTLSKAGILALFAGITVFFLLDHKRDPRVRWLLIFAIAITTVTTLIFAGIEDYFSTLPWVRGRVFLWKGALMLIASHPLCGVGLGGFLPSYPKASARLINGDSTAFMPLGTIDFVHNDPLQMAVEGGLPTAFLYLALIGTAIYISYRSKDDISRGIGAAVAALFLYGLADSPLQVPATFMLFWFLVGLIMAGDQENLSSEHRKDARRPHLKLAAVGVVILVIALLALTQGIRFTAGNLFWNKGKMLLSEKKTSGIEALWIATICLPEIGQVRSEYARALAVNGRGHEALKELDTAMKLYFEFDNVFLRLNLLEKFNERTPVVEEWQRLTQEFPALVTPHDQLGSIYLRQGDVDSAIKEFLEVLEIKQETRRAKAYQEKARQILKNIDDVRVRNNPLLKFQSNGKD